MVQAKTGILVDQTTYELCKSSTSVSFKRLPPIKVKGKAQLVTIFEPSLKETFMAKRGVNMIGRTHELEELEQIAQSIQEPETVESKIVFLEGPPGVGKV